MSASSHSSRERFADSESLNASLVSTSALSEKVWHYFWLYQHRLLQRNVLRRLHVTPKVHLEVVGDALLCPICCHVFRRWMSPIAVLQYVAYTSLDLTVENPYSSIDISKNGMDHEHLEAAAEAGCHICIILQKWMRFVGVPAAADLRRSILLPFTAGSSYKSAKEPFVFYCRIDEKEEDRETRDLQFTVQWRHLGEFHTRRNQYNLITVPVRSMPTSNIIGTSTASDLSFSLANSWIQSCNANHEKCNAIRSSTTKPFLPSRLIYVGNRESNIPPRLCLSDEIPRGTKYATLSHCWGLRPMFRLLTVNLKSLQQLIPSDMLPKTFVDVMIVSQRIGVEYIWIDSLCIIQNSKEDWVQESAVMGDVYRNSWCSIAATGFPDGHKGIFIEREPPTVRCSLGLGRTDPKEIDDTCYMVDPKFWNDGVVTAPLNTRAWVVQERLLAPRILHFGQNQLFWECKECEACETFPSELPIQFRTGFKAAYPFLSDSEVPVKDSEGSSTQKPILLFGKVHDAWEEPELPYPTVEKEEYLPREETEQYLQYWKTVVRLYSSCQLTQSRDKLVALSGIARDMQKFMLSKYLAGLWACDLPSQLLWRTDENPGPRPKAYQAPSWSWASIDRKVTWLEFRHVDNLLGVLDVDVSTIGPDEMGQAETGFLECQCPLQKAETRATDAKTDAALILSMDTTESPQHYLSDFSPFISSNEVDFYLDEPRNQPGETLHLLPIQKNKESLDVLGLLLKRTKDAKGTYRRVGAFAAHGNGAKSILWLRTTLDPDDYGESHGEGVFTIRIV